MKPSEPSLSSGSVVRWLTGDCGIALILALAIPAVLLGMRPPVTQGFDYQVIHQFYKFYLHASIRAGEVPLWNPYVALGRPFLADPEAAVFYPPNWMFIVLPETSALFFFLAAHFFLAAFFFIKLARHWAVPHGMAIGLAFAYCLSGSFMGRLLIGQLGYFCGLAYWPLIFYLAERLREKTSLREWIVLVLAASGSFLSGNPPVFWLTAVALGFYTAGVHLGWPWRENARRGLWCLGVLASAYAFALLLCAVQLLPTIDLMLQGNRTAPSVQFSASSQLDCRFLTTLFVSQPFGWQVGNAWESNLFIGMICTVIGLLGLSQWRDARVRGLCLMGVAGFVLALGQGTPVFAVMFHLLPGMGSFRVAARYATFLPWAMLLAGLIACARGTFSRPRLLFIFCMLLAGAGYVVWRNELYWGIGLIGAIFLAFSALAVALIKPQTWALSKAIASRVLLALLCADSLMAAARMHASYNHLLLGGCLEAQVADVMHQKNLYPSNGVPPRLFVPDSLIRANSGMKYNFSNVTCFGALTSMRVWSYLYLGTGLPVEYLQVVYLSDDAYRAGPFPFPGMNIIVGGRYGSQHLSINPHPGERAYLVHDWKQVPDWTSALQQMVQGHSDPTKVALLEAPAVGPPPAGGDISHDEAVIDAFHRNSIELHVRSSTPSLLVVAEAWYPGWRATVNGVPTGVLPANVWMRAVRVPAGESRVNLYYVEPSLLRGAVISLCALLVLVVIGWRGWRLERSACAPNRVLRRQHGFSTNC
jgi:hypothetical protein